MAEEGLEGMEEGGGGKGIDRDQRRVVVVIVTYLKRLSHEEMCFDEVRVEIQGSLAILDKIRQ